MTARGDAITAAMAAIRREVTGPAHAVESGVHPIAGVPTTDGRLVEGAPPVAIPGVPTTPALPDDLDATVRALLAPLLKAWLDAHLPEIVEAAVQAEIARLTGQA